MRIVFLGTPDFAVPSLQILVENNYNVVGVVTTADKMGGRGGKQLLETPIKKYANSQNIKVLQPKNLKSSSFVDELKELNADLQIVVAFRMLPEVVWNMPKHGTYNLHGSLLPKYRGAAPINWAVIRGEKKTGVTSFKLKHKIDTGDTLFQESLRIRFVDTATDVHDRMMDLGATVILKTVKAVESGNLQLLRQDESEVSKAPKLFQENCKIDFTKSTLEIYNFIRGLSYYPAAWTTFREKKLKVFWAEFECKNHTDPTGHITTDGKTFLNIACKDGYIVLKDIQLAGKKRMKVEAFLRGIKN